MAEKNKKIKTTLSGIKLKSHYGDKRAGEYPFVSGIYANMYKDRLWTMRQYAGFSSAKKSNELIAGPTIVCIPTLMNLLTSLI